MSETGVDFKMMMVSSTPLPDGTTLYDLAMRPDIGQEEALAAFEAAMNDSRDTPKLTFHAVKIFAMSHGYNAGEAMMEAVMRQLEVMSVGLPLKQH